MKILETSTVISILACLISLGSFWICIQSFRRGRIPHLQSAELYIFFEEDGELPEDLMVLANVGRETLEMDVTLFIDPLDDDRYPEGSKPVWTFRRRLYPHKQQKWLAAFGPVLNAMGYRQDCTYLLRFVGSFWPAAAGKRYSQEFFQKYRVIRSPQRRLFVDCTNSDRYHADASGRKELERSRIPIELAKRNELKKPPYE